MKHHILIAILIGILFIALSHPLTYQTSDKVLQSMNVRTTFDNMMGLPTLQGIVLHAVVFTLLVFLILHVKRVKFDKWRGMDERKSMVIEKPLESELI
jgi:formate-dependent nitrite reductase membrane component NrfD